MTRSRSRAMCRNPPAISASIALLRLVVVRLRRRRVAGGRAGDRVDAPHEHRGQQEGGGVEEEDDLRRSWSATSSAPRAGPRKKARLSIVLEAPLAAVSSSGRRVSDGIQAICAGRNTQPMRREDRRDHDDDGGRRVDEERDPGHGGEQRPDQVAADEHRLAREPVGEGRPDGGDDRHEHVAHGHPDADEARAAHAVGPDHDRGGVGPVADHRRGQGGLDAPQGGVAEDRSQGRPRVAEGATDQPGWRDVRICVDSHNGSLHRRGAALIPSRWRRRAGAVHSPKGLCRVDGPRRR